MNLKKLFLLAVLFFSTTALFAKTKIVTTIFPVYDWVREITKGKESEFDITLLVENGVDLHNYQVSVQDIAKISSTDIFIYIGGESDSWVKDVLKNVKNKNLVTINLLEELGDKAKEEAFVEGMQEDEHEHHHHEHEHHDHEHDDDEIEYDEHIWLSLPNAVELTQKITNAICKKDAKNASSYQANLSSYTAQLKTLHTSFKKVVANAKNKTLIFGDRFPFRYFTDDYALTYFAAFQGCSAETEASFKTIVFLSQKLDELKLAYICKIENSSDKIAKTVIKNSKSKNAKILTFDSMQSVTKKDIKKGTTYITLMTKNFETLKVALSNGE